MHTPFHIIVEGNPAIVYGSRGGDPSKILPVLHRFLTTFWQERDTSGEICETPECLVAQLIVRFGFESCEDDFSNLRVGVNYNANAKYLYQISCDRDVTVWIPDAAYQSYPNSGIKGCRSLVPELAYH